GRELESEIKSLRQRKNQIPKSDVEIRERLLQSLQSNGMDVSDATFPFVGELLKVREDYAEWEPAIQRLLGGFGRQLLVPSNYYFAVSDFVERTNLKGRLVYHRVQEMRQVSEESLPENALFHRLQIKTGTGFTEWLREKLIDSFNYVCVDINEFRRASHAITINGQVKHGKERHEKDDRFRLGDRSRYVLGWENEAKIRELEDQLNVLSDKFQQLAKQEKNIQSRKKILSDQKRDYEAILFFDSFAVLDVTSVAQELTTTQQELDRLKAQVAESQLAFLQEQLETVKEEITKADRERRNIDRELGRLEGNFNTQNKRLQGVIATLADIDMDAMRETLNEIDSDMLEILDKEPSLENTEKGERQLRTLYSSQLKGQNDRLRAMERDAIAQMQAFKGAYRVETQDVDASLEPTAVKWYEEKYTQIHHHDLPRYKEEFEELVRKKITDSITSFRSGMLTQVQEYRKRIDQLNESLREISYTSETYIQLIYEDTSDQQIRAFSADLVKCFPDVSAYGDNANRQAYLNVRDLIKRLDEETYWARKVTDVRNWLDFAADERRKSDDSQQERYEGASAMMV
ncbi:MAG: hypothetical protein AAFN11_14685, partial [Chloroflexota bacterium]